MNDKYQYIIIEDEEIQAEGLAETLKKKPELQLKEMFDNNEDALAYLEEGDNLKMTDIIFLDLCHGDEEDAGFMFLDQIKSRLEHQKVFIISAHNKAIRSLNNYKMVSSYILKPMDEKQLFGCIDEALKTTTDFEEESIVLKLVEAIDPKGESYSRKIFYKDILFIESCDNGNKIKIHTRENDYISKSRINMAEVGNMLGEKYFMRIHNGFIINKEYVNGHKNYSSVILKFKEDTDNTDVSIGPKFRKDFKEWFQGE